MAETKTFHWLDYLIFSLMLAISVAIGLFYAWKDKKNQSTDEFLLGGRRMSVLPVTLSLMANFLSAVLVLGVPTEIYYNGTMYWLTSFSNFITFPIAVHVFLPLFHNLQLTSVNKYLQLRFNGILRILGSIIFQVQMFLYMAVMLYAPALALNQVMGFSMMVSILVIGLVCTLYTAIGGLKAVLWTDAFQIVIVFSGLLALVIKATTELGGFEYVWNTAKNAGKLQINNFDPDPFVRNTFWTLVIGGFMTSLTIYGGNQAVIQRYLSMETVKSAQTALYINLPASIVFTSLLVYAGLVLFAKYGEADPVGCAIDRRDQMIPWLVMDILGDYHGFPGLMVACIFSASLSTVSSGVNALALVFTSDIIEPLYFTVTKEHIPNKHATICSKMLAFLFGFLTIGLAFTADKMGNLILQISFSIFGMIGGPLLGLFIMAMFFPCINPWGAGLGTICGLTFAFWLGVGSIIKTGSPPTPTCEIIDMNLSHPDNVTFPPEYRNSLSPMDITTVLEHTSLTTLHELSTTGNTMELSSTESGLDKFYRLSYMWYSASSIIVGIFVALIVSCATGGTRKKPVEEKLLAPLYLYLKSFAKTKYSNEEESKGRQIETRKRMTSSVATLYVQNKSPHQELQPTNSHIDIVTHL